MTRQSTTQGDDTPNVELPDEALTALAAMLIDAAETHMKQMEHCQRPLAKVHGMSGRLGR
jgi:hypothetical protein